MGTYDTRGGTPRSDPAFDRFTDHEHQRAPLWKRLLRRPLCWAGRHRVGYRKGRKVFENFARCAFCGRKAW